MKISVITVTRNAGKAVEGTLRSVLAQKEADIELIVVDGASNDGTAEAVAETAADNLGRIKWMSEPDTGIYNAINKGIAMATGDVIGTLHAGDRFHHDRVLADVTSVLADGGTAFVYGDVGYVDGESRVPTGRMYRAAGFRPSLLLGGFAPPHPSLYIRRDVVERVGGYRENYAVAADFEYFVRLMLIHGERGKYLREWMVDMAAGGLSSRWRNRLWANNVERLKALRENGLPANPLRLLRRYLYL